MWEEAHLGGNIEKEKRIKTIAGRCANIKETCQMNKENCSVSCIERLVYLTKYLVKYIIYNTSIYISTM